MDGPDGDTAAWHQQLRDQMDVLHQHQQQNTGGQSEFEDLSNIFDFGEIDLGDAAAGLTVDGGQHARGDDMAQDFMLDPAFDLQQSGHQQAHQRQQMHAHTPTTTAPNNATNAAAAAAAAYAAAKAAYHQSMAQQQQQFDVQFQVPPQGYGQAVPPTPTSFELHGEAARFLMMHQQQQHQHQHQHQQAMQAHQLHLANAAQMAFTPSASPHGTPQFDAQGNITHINPGAYFSPLTSPMLLAQSQQMQQQQQGGYHTASSTAPSSYAPSPNDAANLDFDMLGDAMALPAPASDHSRKPARKKDAAPNSAGPLPHKPKPSPASTPRKRKSRFQGTEGVADTLASSASSRSLPGSAGLRLPPSSSPETDSVSPEPLADSIMGPPPRPRSSATDSPAIAPQIKEMSLDAVGAAMTPKSLLSTRPDQQNPGGGPHAGGPSMSTGGLEELALPAAAKPRRPSVQIDTQITQGPSWQDTPRIAARKTPKLGPESTPSSLRATASATSSPAPLMSPQSATTPAAILKDGKIDLKGRGARKRGGGGGGSHGGSAKSPALRPKISPSIKPLLPESSSLHSSTHALLLASKSNYQNLVEGNLLPGVSYPEHLSTGLTSKRTSHKVAEQGRRNRINEALKEMQSLLPQPSGPKPAGGAKANDVDAGSPEDGGVDGEADGGKASKETAEAKAASSKAATVESANIYIRELQKENAVLLMLKRENEEMKRKLEERDKATAATPAGAAPDSSSSSSSISSSSSTGRRGSSPSPANGVPTDSSTANGATSPDRKPSTNGDSAGGDEGHAESGSAAVA